MSSSNLPPALEALIESMLSDNQGKALLSKKLQNTNLQRKGYLQSLTGLAGHAISNSSDAAGLLGVLVTAQELMKHLGQYKSVQKNEDGSILCNDIVPALALVNTTNVSQVLATLPSADVDLATLNEALTAHIEQSSTLTSNNPAGNSETHADTTSGQAIVESTSINVTSVPGSQTQTVSLLTIAPYVEVPVTECPSFDNNCEEQPACVDDEDDCEEDESPCSLGHFTILC